MQDFMLMLTQNQNELSKKWDDLLKKQEDFEAKMAREREDLIKEKMRVKDE